MLTEPDFIPGNDRGNGRPGIFGGKAFSGFILSAGYGGRRGRAFDKCHAKMDFL